MTANPPISSSTYASGGRMLSVESAATLIRTGRAFSIAGEENLLRQLPAGMWVGGTIPYFMGQSGGETSRDKVFVAELPRLAQPASLASYGEGELDRICADAPDHAVSVVVIPAFSGVHALFARHSPEYEDMYVKPLLGWIAGIHLDDFGNRAPLAVNGQTLSFEHNKAVVLHVPLPKNFKASIDIINLFKPGNGSPIVFEDSGFKVDRCTVAGRAMRFVDHIKAHHIDTRLPLVADCGGAMVNVSIRSVNEADGTIDLYGPVFEHVEYRFAAPVADYVSDFHGLLPTERRPVNFACNCVLNYLYLELEGKRMPDMLGPMTFGEVAYQLLNQTLVYLRIEPV